MPTAMRMVTTIVPVLVCTTNLIGIKNTPSGLANPLGVFLWILGGRYRTRFAFIFPSVGKINIGSHQFANWWQQGSTGALH